VAIKLPKAVVLPAFALTASQANCPDVAQACPERPLINIGTMTDYARSLGFAGRFQLNLPKGDTGVWIISQDSMSNDGGGALSGDRTLRLDQYTGKVVGDVGFADYTAYAKAMAWALPFMTTICAPEIWRSMRCFVFPCRAFRPRVW
jgi:uncharacterized iron-regulated membrane protein